MTCLGAGLLELRQLNGDIDPAQKFNKLPLRENSDWVMKVRLSAPVFRIRIRIRIKKCFLDPDPH